MKPRNLKSLGLRIGISVACLIWVFSQVDPGQLINDIASFPLLRLLIILLLAISLLFAPALRILVLTDFKCGILGALEAHVLTMGVNMILPMKLGEAAKMIHLHHTSKLAWSVLLGRIFWERFLDLNVIVVLAILVSVLALPETAGYFVVTLAGIFWAALFMVRLKPQWPIIIANRLPGKRLKRFCVESLNQFQQTFRLQFIGRLAACTLIVWAIYGGVTVISVLVLGLPLTIPQAMVYFVATAGALAIPSAPGAVGVYEAAAVAVCVYYGIAKEQALAAAITIHLLVFLPGLVWTLLLMAKGKFRLAEARQPRPG